MVHLELRGQMDQMVREGLRDPEVALERMVIPVKLASKDLEVKVVSMDQLEGLERRVKVETQEREERMDLMV